MPRQPSPDAGAGREPVKKKVGGGTLDRAIGRPHFGAMRSLDREIHDFTEDVIDRSRIRPMLVEYWTPWCEQSRMCAEILSSVCAQYPDAFEVATVNAEMHFELMALLGIRSIPALQFYVGGRLVGALSGLESREAIGDWLKDMVASSSSATGQTG